MQLDWKLKQKKNFIFYYNNDTKIPIDNFQPNCQSFLDNPSASVEEAFTDWNKFMKDLPGSDVLQSYLHLFKLNPENSQVKAETVRQPFISNLTISFNKPTFAR